MLLHDEVCKLECDVDDCSGEILGYTLERLLEAGALDVHYTPVYMKKNRPAWELTVLCHGQKREALEEIIFRETTTIGIRRTLMQRDILPRERGEVQTEYGAVQVKLCGANCYVEYDSAAKIARAQGVALQKIYDAVRKAEKRH